MSKCTNSSRLTAVKPGQSLEHTEALTLGQHGVDERPADVESPRINTDGQEHASRRPGHTAKDLPIPRGLRGGALAPSDCGIAMAWSNHAQACDRISSGLRLVTSLS